MFRCISYSCLILKLVFNFISSKQNETKDSRLKVKKRKEEEESSDESSSEESADDTSGEGLYSVVI